MACGVCNGRGTTRGEDDTRLTCELCEGTGRTFREWRAESAALKSRVAEMEVERAELRAACMASEVAIRDCIRRPLGVEPDTATVARRLIATALGTAPAPGSGG